MAPLHLTDLIGSTQYTNRLKFLLPSWIFANVSVKFDIWRAIIEQLRGSTSRDR